MSRATHWALVAHTCLALAAAIGIAADGRAQDFRSESNFRWEADAVRGALLTIRNGNGNVRIEAGDVDKIIVQGTKLWTMGDPTTIALKVERYGPRDRNVLLCAEWDQMTLGCTKTSYSVNNSGKNDARLDLLVTVPRWMQVEAATVNGDIYVTALASDVTGSVVNGNVTIAVGDEPAANVTIATVNGRFHSDLALPSFRHVGRGTTRLRLGPAGRNITFATVNAGMRLVRE